jgi:hypothetical protein
VRSSPNSGFELTASVPTENVTQTRGGQKLVPSLRSDEMAAHLAESNSQIIGLMIDCSNAAETPKACALCSAKQIYWMASSIFLAPNIGWNIRR